MPLGERYEWADNCRFLSGFGLQQQLGTFISDGLSQSATLRETTASLLA
jgi:hypothetical protein